MDESSIEKPQGVQISPKKLANLLPVAQETTVPTPPPEVVAERLSHAEGEEDLSFTLNQLALEELLSEEQ